MFSNLCPGAVGLGGPMADVLSLAKAVGFEGVDPNLGEPVEETRALYEELGLRVGTAGLPVDFRGEECKYEQGMAGLVDFAGRMQGVGATRCATWLLPFSDELTYQENFDLHVRRLKPAAQLFAAHGIRLGLEFVGTPSLRGGKAHEFVHTLTQVLELCAAIGGDNVGLLLDAWHWYTSHGTVEELRQLTNDDIVLVHVNDAPAGIEIDEQLDNVRDLPGETGVIDLPTFMGVLKEIGYDGPVSPEPFCQRLNDLERRARAEAVANSLKGIMP
ncbi:MAG: sugar phosphate isomerase/epimerase [Lentisphaerae bacterium]|jgi:sugar phosphate isomerase/epimerase|nr:sugar phosphate isomerase/epimerase [Lentisphaerota bacterium]MBT4818211.1 sugar phosphate isomerase/epimerase [Lentisphaerota bacterium]MBT5607527.1 sugar phosphate isomerase/epimerase [Lentisphaerota bacterium]MBT7054400.1 sugar phosphate isomerase/epimerase [Lentisphaerota bacterium]MBT7848013.1 sugar phosphate isomerase/epimerase [Lentisphaerota bacterium]